MSSEAQNSPFIKNLASSDKETRDQALDALRTYLSGRSQISELDLLKLWKGLFYCLWMQDKPALQQRLGRDLAGLVGELKEGVVVGFLEAFWRTMGREWGGIDALRMDKFLYLVRQYVNASFRYLSRKSWSNDTAISDYNRIMEEGPLHPTNAKIPNGLRYHLLDIYLDELEKVGGEKMEEVPVDRLLEPIQKLVEQSRTKSVRNAAKDLLADERIRIWRGETVSENGAMDETGDNDEWDGIED